MALHLNKLPEFQAPDPLNFQPLAQGIDSINQAQQQRDQRAQQQQQFDTTNALSERRVGLAERQAGQQDEEAFTKKIGAQAGVVDAMPDGPQRQAAWNALIGRLPDVDKHMATYGVSHEDHINGPKFLMAEAFGPKDPQREAQANAQTRYTNTLADEAQRRGSVLQQDADTKRFATIASAFGGKVPTRAEWDAQNQNGGIVNAAFGGPVPYEKAPGIIQMAQARKNVELDADGLRDRNFSPEQIMQMRRQQDIVRAYGQPKRGYHWDMSPQGQPVQVLDAEKEDPKQKQRDQTAPFYMKNLETARQVLDKTNPVGRAIASSRVGGYINPSTAEALQLVGHAVTALTAMVEGNRHANAQDVRFLQYFQPNATDSNEIINFKLDQATQFFKSYLSNKAAGRSDDYLSNRFSSQVQKSFDELQKKQGGKPAPNAGSPRGWKIEKVE